MSDGHEWGFFEARVSRDLAAPAGSEGGQPGQGQPGDARPEEADEATPDEGVASTSGTAAEDETLFAAFMAARESAMAAPDPRPVSPRVKRRIAVFLVAVFLLSLAAGFAASRWML
jgi:hypothetical protein